MFMGVFEYVHLSILQNFNRIRQDNRRRFFIILSFMYGEGEEKFQRKNWSSNSDIKVILK